MKNKIISWFSGGVTSAVTCQLCIEMFGRENVRIIFMDTRNEHPDTYRFLKDCEDWYRIKIETIASEKYKTIQDVWREHLSLNTGHGAICSSCLKRDVRLSWQKNNEYSCQAFGFDKKEGKRVLSLISNYPETNPIFPLRVYKKNKKQCIKMLEASGLEIPLMYRLGYHNNNCFETGCVQGGIGYWQKIAN